MLILSTKGGVLRGLTRRSEESRLELPEGLLLDMSLRANRISF